MFADQNAGDSDNYRPLTYLGQVPLYATTLLVILHVAAMIATAILISSGAAGILSLLSFQTPAITGEFQIWRAVTYAFIDPPSLWFVIEMYLLYTFGREVEKFVGRRAFLALYGVLLLVVPLVLSVAYFIGLPTQSSLPMVGGYTGSSAIHFAVFIAFCTIYPGAQIFFSIQAKWIALVLVGINSLEALASHSWSSLAVLWVACATAFLMLRRQGVGNWDFFRRFLPKPTRRKPTFRVVKREPDPPADPEADIDILLEKISAKGIASLTRQERERLERAREQLLQKERKN